MMREERRALVVGASGQVGRACMREFGDAGWETIGTYHGNPRPGLIPLDLADRGALRLAVRDARPSVCVISSAFTNVDGCEDDPDRAHVLNAVGPGILAEACRAAGARVIHLSTEYVFDGANGPYNETDPVSPISVYGRTKLEGERAVLSATPDAIIARTTVVYSYDPTGKNFVMQLASRVGRGERMRVPADQVSSPTYAPDVAMGLRLLLDAGGTGVFNVVGPEIMDRYAFAVLCARALGLPEHLLDPVDTASLSQKARRPLRAGLKCAAVESAIAWRPRPPVEALRLVQCARESAAATEQ